MSKLSGLPTDNSRADNIPSLPAILLLPRQLEDTKQTYRPEVDGLRAIAVLLVLCFHFELGVPGGFVGVDVFFVISGYLITSLIQNDLDNGRPLFLEFWSRRIIRILPALATMVVVVLCTGWLVLLPSDYRQLGESGVAQSLMIANIHFWRHTGYFAAPALTMPLLHTWSLALEEQFYVVLPIALYSIRRTPLAYRQILLLAAGIASFIVAVYGVKYHSNATFFLLPTRAWELLLGSLISTIPLSLAPKRTVAEGLSGIGLLLVLVPGFTYTQATPFPGAAALAPCLGAAMVIFANGQRLTYVGAALASPAFLIVGLMSYSLYLWHWPIYVFATYWRSEPLTVTMRLGLVGMSVAVAYCSWRFLETPLRKRSSWSSRAAIFSFAAAALGLVGIFGGALVAGQGFPSRIPSQALAFASAKADAPYFHQVTLEAIKKREFYGVGKKTTGPIDLLIWGDSHAMAVEPILAEMGNNCGLRMVGAHYASTAPLLGFTNKSPFSLRERSAEFNHLVMEYIRAEKISAVILIAAWNGYIDDGITKSIDGRQAVRRNFRESVIETVRVLDQIGTKVWIMEMVPIYKYDVPRKLAAETYWGGNLLHVGKSLDEHQRNTAFESSVFREVQQLSQSSASRLEVLDPARHLCPSGRCQTHLDGRSLYIDNNHLSLTGSRLLREMFEPVLFDLLRDNAARRAESNCAIRNGSAVLNVRQG